VISNGGSEGVEEWIDGLAIPVHGPSFYSAVAFVALHEGAYTAHQQLPVEAVVVFSCLSKSMATIPDFT
jgi:hypothetical protein